MPTLAERLRAILEPRYQLGPRIGAGGMAVVFRAEDATLSRPVAVKVLRPELATAVGAERFLREARALASISHPNVVAVHECGARDGIHFYVMSLEESPTLRACLDEGACSTRDAYRVGIDLLAALDAAHAQGVVHRDVKPSNIFLRPDRAVLADFGVARDASTESEPLTGTELPGTPAYMAPEQAAGGEATVRSDLYSAGMVVYEAFTGRRWPAFQPPARADWSGVPRRARTVLARALDPDPARRWRDAAAFRDALRRARRRRPVGLRVAVVALGALAMVLLWVAWPKSPPRTTSDLAVLPCGASGGVPQDAGILAADYAADELFVTEGVAVAEADRVIHLAQDTARRPAPDDWAAWSAELRADWIATCRLSPADGGWLLETRLYGAAGERAGPERHSVPPNPVVAGDRLYASVVVMLGAVGLELVSADEAPHLSRYGHRAVLDYLNGKDAFRGDRLKRAVELFSSALAEEPGFALAEWRLAEARRWLAHESVGTDLAELHARSAGLLGRRDSMLLAARVAPYREKPRLLEATFREYPYDAYVTLLFADELYHRGGLWGLPLDSAVTLLKTAVWRDPKLVPAVEHYTQALIRTGRRDTARAMLGTLRDVSGPAGQLDVYYPDIWEQAWRERWSPETAAAGFEALLRTAPTAGPADGISGPIEFLDLGARWVRYVELPASQAMLGRTLVDMARRAGGAEPQVATGFLAVALGELGRGRIGAAIAAFDSVAAVAGTAETRLQAAEWRVLPFAIGLEGFDRSDAEDGIPTLEAIRSDRGLDPCLRARAALARALAERALAGEHLRGGAAESGWDDTLASLPKGRPLVPGGDATLLLRGLDAAGGGNPGRALAITEPLAAYDSVALDANPFGRALVYWLRAGWQAEAGDTAAALRTLYWHENTDLEEGTPPGIAQAAEVDAAFGVHARARAVQLAGSLEGVQRVAGLPRCELVRTRADDVLRLWAAPDPPLGPLRDEVRRIRDRIERECRP